MDVVDMDYLADISRTFGLVSIQMSNDEVFLDFIFPLQKPSQFFLFLL